MPSRKSKSKTAGPIVYIHGIGDQPPKAMLKREWDIAIFGRPMGHLTEMAYWSDILHSQSARKAARAGKTINVEKLLNEAQVSTDNSDARNLAEGLIRAMGIKSQSARKKVLPLPAFLRRPIARAFLKTLIRDTAAYFFKQQIRAKTCQRLKKLIVAESKPRIIVAHSQGSIIALEVLAELASKTDISIEHFVTIGSPLGIREIQDFLSCPLEIPPNIKSWINFSDPLDPVALDKGIANDFDPDRFISDRLVMNTQSRKIKGFNPHSAVGYLAHPKVRGVMHDASRIDAHARFLVSRDVAAEMASDLRQSVLIEVLEPGFPAIGESLSETVSHEKAEGVVTLAGRIERAAERIKALVEPKSQLKEARVDRLRRFVAARLTSAELYRITEEHRDLRIYAVWKSSRKAKLVHRSMRVVHVDAARASYNAYGRGIRWAVLDTGARYNHPHFKTHDTIIETWDCTKTGPPRSISRDLDPDGHGTHVAGIIAGSSKSSQENGMAPLAKLIVYKVLDNSGNGEDAWIIKALDHIAERNENNSDIFIHGINLSLGGPYDPTVYGCGFTPICVELRRLWRAGVLVCVACGNEGQVEVITPDGEVDLNMTMSIGDPANLEDCIAVGSVNADRPHLYGISSFSSRGPTSDGRMKPDLVAPGERIHSCNSRFVASDASTFYVSESGTSMAAPHVSGLLAAFLSVRREFRGRPDEVKEILLRTCTDIHRNQYHQGRGIPNLMRMLLEA